MNIGAWVRVASSAQASTANRLENKSTHHRACALEATRTQGFPQELQIC